jgi:hypothetical protein
MSISSELAKQAKIKGICQEWYLILKNEKDIDSLLDMYIKGLDFCLSNNYPSNDYISKNFKGKMESHGIHLNEFLDIVNERKVIALGKTTGTVKIKDYEVSEIFVKNNSELTIMASGNSFVMIDIFDDSKVIVFASDDAKVVIMKYGGRVLQDSKDDSCIKIIEKNKTTY